MAFRDRLLASLGKQTCTARPECESRITNIESSVSSPSSQTLTRPKSTSASAPGGCSCGTVTATRPDSSSRRKRATQARTILLSTPWRRERPRIDTPSSRRSRRIRSHNSTFDNSSSFAADHSRSPEPSHRIGRRCGHFSRSKRPQAGPDQTITTSRTRQRRARPGSDHVLRVVRRLRETLRPVPPVSPGVRWDGAARSRCPGGSRGSGLSSTAGRAGRGTRSRYPSSGRRAARSRRSPLVQCRDTARR